MAENTVVQAKLSALEEFMKAQGIEGVAFEKPNEQVGVARSAFLVEGQEVPFMILMNETVFTSFQVLLAQGIHEEEKQKHILVYLNKLNNQFNMLKYHLDGDGNVILTCSVPASDNHFEPALIAALIEEVKKHLDEQYAELMKEIWA